MPGWASGSSTWATAQGRRLKYVCHGDSIPWCCVPRMAAAAAAEPSSVSPLCSPEKPMAKVDVPGVLVLIAVATRLESSPPLRKAPTGTRSEEHTSELQSLAYLVCR